MGILLHWDWHPDHSGYSGASLPAHGPDPAATTGTLLSLVSSWRGQLARVPWLVRNKRLYWPLSLSSLFPPFPNKISCFVSTCDSLDNSFPSVRQEPSFGPWKGSPFLQQMVTQTLLTYFPFPFSFILWIHWRSHVICPVHRFVFSHSVLSNSWLLHGHLFYESEKWKSLSHIRLFATPWTIQSMEFSRPESWSGQPFPAPGDLPNPGLPHCRQILYQLSHQGRPICSIERPIFSICLVVPCWYHLTCSSVLFIFCELVIYGALFRFKFNFLARIFHTVLYFLLHYIGRHNGNFF